MYEVVLGRPLLKCIGFDLNKHLVSVFEKIDKHDLSEKMAEQLNTGRTLLGDKTRRLCSLKSYKGPRYDQTESDSVDTVPTAGTKMGVELESDITAALVSTMRAAKDEVMSAKGLATAEALLHEFRDIIWTKLGTDPPAKLEPLKVRMQPTA